MIPFIRVYPNGRNGLAEISRSEEVEAIARRFIANDGRYLVTLRTDGRVAVAAAILVDGEPEAAAEEICDNGPELLDTIDAVVRASITHKAVFQ